MDVSDVLRDRVQAPAGLQRMVAVSIAVHAVFATLVVTAPRHWLGQAAQAPRVVMNISLGGAAGADAGGMTTIGNRPVQVQTPQETTKPEPVRPPAAVTPEMTIPRPGAKPTKVTPGPTVKQAPDEARGRTPTRGAQTSAGSAIAETGAPRGQGFGLSTGGQGFGGTLDVADFCCPEYLQTMAQRIRSIWQQNQGAAGQTVIKFTIQRDGTLTDIVAANRSGIAALDLAAQRAVVMTKRLPPLPDQFPNPTLTVNLIFDYKR
jgi:TonB family protein